MLCYKEKSEPLDRAMAYVCMISGVICVLRWRIVNMDWIGILKLRLDWICETWIYKTRTGLDLQNMDWIGFVKHGLDWIYKTWTGLDL